MRQVCDILDNASISYDWYVLGTSFKKEEFEEIKSWFQGNLHVHFLGYQNNVYPYIKQMDYLALLTDRESWGLVISEALILGVPCITTNFEGVDKQISDGENGILLEMNDANGIYEKKLRKIVHINCKMKENIRKNDYSREHIINRWISILQ